MINVKKIALYYQQMLWIVFDFYCEEIRQLTWSLQPQLCAKFLMSKITLDVLSRTRIRSTKSVDKEQHQKSEVEK